MNLYNLFQNTAGDQVSEAYDRPFRGVGGAFHRGDDEHHEIDRAREQRDQSGTWYIRINGKILKSRDGQPYTFRGKAAANKAALTMQAKPFNAGKEFMLTTNPVDKQAGVTEAPTSAAVRLGRAVQRVQGKTAASQARAVIPSSIPKPVAKPPVPVREDEELHIGDPVIVTGPVEFEGSTGEISDFGSGKRFVVVNLYNHGRHSFHTSDISYNDYADSDEEEARAYDSDPDARNRSMGEQGVVEGLDTEELANEVYAEFERTYPNLARRADERTVHAAIMDVLNYGGDSNPSALAQDVARAVKQEMQQGVAEAAAPVTHRIGLTVTDPNHPMISKRGETYQKSVRVTGPDREAAINQAIAHHRRKGYKVHDHHYLGTVDQGVAEALDSNFVGFMNKTLGQKADAPTDKSPMPDFMKGAPVAGLDSMGYKAALDFGMKTLRKLTPTQKTKLSIKGEDGVVNWLANQAKKQGLLITDESDEDTQGKFMQEDLDEVQDFLPEVFHDPAIKSWAFVLTDGEPLPKAPVAGPFKVGINPGITGQNGYANADWKTVDTLENLPDARDLAQGLSQKNPKQFVAIWAANGKSAGFYWPGEGWRGIDEGVAEGFNGEYDDEAGMAQSNLITTARAVMGLLKTIKDRDNLPEWGQEKIAKAEMMLVSVWDYLQSQKAMGNDPQQGVAEGDAYFESLQSMMERQLEPNMDLDAWVDNFQNADPNKYHQFKNKTPEKKK